MLYYAIIVHTDIQQNNIYASRRTRLPRGWTLESPTSQPAGQPDPVRQDSAASRVCLLAGVHLLQKLSSSGPSNLSLIRLHAPCICHMCTCTYACRQSTGRTRDKYVIAVSLFALLQFVSLLLRLPQFVSYVIAVSLFALLYDCGDSALVLHHLAVDDCDAAEGDIIISYGSSIACAYVCISLSLSLSMYIYIYMYTFTHMYIYIYILCISHSYIHMQYVCLYFVIHAAAEGDIIVLGSDGVFDNLFLDEV